MLLALYLVIFFEELCLRPTVPKARSTTEPLKPNRDSVRMYFISYLQQHYQKDADGLCCRLKYSVEKKEGNIEYTVSLQDFEDRKLSCWGRREAWSH